MESSKDNRDSHSEKENEVNTERSANSLKNVKSDLQRENLETKNTEDEPLVSNEKKTLDDKSNTLQKLGLFILNNYLPICLVVFVIFGILVPKPGHVLNTKATKYVCVVLIFVYTGLYLRTKEIKEAVTAYKAAIWGFISILGVTCMIGGSLTGVLNKSLNTNNVPLNQNDTNISISGSKISSIGPVEFRYGLQIYLVMPCTISSGVVMVTQLNGHVALAVLLTVVSNIIGVFSVPLYLKWLVFQNVAVSFDIPALLLKLSLTILLPIIVGKCLGSIKKIQNFVTIPNHKRVLKTISITLLVIIVWVTVSSTSYKGQFRVLTAASVFFIIGWAIGMHFLFIFINLLATGILRLPKDQQKCIIILASQKTLAVGVSILAFLPEKLGEIGLIAIGMVIGHLSVLITDSFLISLWLKYEKRKEKENENMQLDTQEN